MQTTTEKFLHWIREQTKNLTKYSQAQLLRRIFHFACLPTMVSDALFWVNGERVSFGTKTKQDKSQKRRLNTERVETEAKQKILKLKNTLLQNHSLKNAAFHRHCMA